MADAKPSSGSQSDLLAAALAYAKRGWLVFPVHSVRSVADGAFDCTCGQPRCPKSAKHPRTAHGFKDATIDQTRLSSWWHQHPDSNIGIVTGIKSRLVVLDVDPRNGGEASLDAWRAEHGGLPPTFEVRTGGMGSHFYFAYPSGVDHIASRSNWDGRRGLDLKADGGYVVGPPSRHVLGSRYAWTGELGLHGVMATLPPPFLTAKRARRLQPSRNGKVSAQGQPIFEGERNVRLASMAGSMRHADVDPASIGIVLDKTNQMRCRPPLPIDEVARITASITGYPANEAPQALALTDLGNAERLIALHGKDLLHCHATRQWLLWDGRRWKADNTAAVERMAMNAVRAIRAEADAQQDGEERRRLLKHALRSEGRRFIEAMVSHARALCPASPEEFDADPWAFNVQNGTIDLKTGLLHPHARESRITKLAPVTFDPGAQHPVWTSFLERMIPDPEVRAYLARAAGYSLTGITTEEQLFFLHGPTATGKSTLAEALRAVWGDSAATADFESFLKHRKEGVRNDLARLAGKRMVLALEVDEGRQLAVAVLKSLTGGDTVAARFLHREFFEFVPTFKIWFFANDKPRANPSDQALWRRVNVVPFLVSLTDKERDPSVKQTLTRNPRARSAILAWAVRGLVEWREIGLRPPSSVRLATAAYQEECDELGDFFEARCVLKPHLQTTSASLKAACDLWCQENGIALPTSKALASALTRRGCRATKLGGERAWSGIGLGPLRNDGADA